MRLTLRTLLAYLYGLLEPEDAQEIKRKVSQPGRGQELAERIPRLVSRRELEAPRLDAKAAGADPNIVSDYLDGILTPERTAEFDRVCLQSDRQLAEVASCFEILSVVQRPIKVSAGLRQSMYRVVDTVAKHDAATRSEIPSQVLDSHEELSEEDRAAILEEYVDAPVLKPAGARERSKPDRPQPESEAARDTTSIEPTRPRTPQQRPVRSKSPWREEEQPKPAADEMAGAPMDRNRASDADDESVEDDDMVIMADKNWFESDLESFLKSRDDGASGAVDEFGAEIEPAPTSPGRSAKAPSQVITPTEFVREENSVEAPPLAGAQAGVEQEPEISIQVDHLTTAAKSGPESLAGPTRASSSFRRWIPVIAVAVLALVLGAILFVVLGGPSSLLSSNSSSDSHAESDAPEKATDARASTESKGETESPGKDRADESNSSGDTKQQPANDATPTESDLAGAKPNNPEFPSFDAPDLSAPVGGDDREAGEAIVGDGTPVLQLPSDLDPSADAGDDAPMEIELPDPNAPLAKLVSSNSVLARLDDTRDGWYRIPDEGAIQRVDRLLNFPSYHTRLLFGDAIQVALNGAAGLEVLGVVQDRPQLALRFGRFSASSVGKANAELNLQVDDIQARITLVEADSRIAVRRLAFLPPGADPVGAGAQVLVDVVAVQGRVIWEDANGPKILDAGQARRYVDGVATDVVSLPTIPYWVDSQVADIDLRGSESVAELVGNDQPINEAFSQLVDDSHVEVRMLAVQCLSLLGQHEPVISALGNDRNKSYWTDLIEWVRGALARGPAQAEAVYAGIQEASPDNAAIVYRLIVGFSEAQVIGGADAELIDLLESPDLVLRVLAADNLLRITGSRGMYRPETSERIRESHIRTWRKQLDEGAVRYSQPPQLPSISGTRMGE